MIIMENIEKNEIILEPQEQNEQVGFITLKSKAQIELRKKLLTAENRQKLSQEEMRKIQKSAAKYVIKDENGKETEEFFLLLTLATPLLSDAQKITFFKDSNTCKSSELSDQELGVDGHKEPNTEFIKYCHKPNDIEQIKNQIVMNTI